MSERKFPQIFKHFMSAMMDPALSSALRQQERDIEGVASILGISQEEATTMLANTRCPPRRFFEHLKDGWNAGAIIKAYNDGMKSLPTLSVTDPSEELVALCESLGQPPPLTPQQFAEAADKLHEFVTADEIARQADRGQDVSRYFTNDGTMKPPFDEVIIDTDAPAGGTYVAPVGTPPPPLSLTEEPPSPWTRIGGAPDRQQKIECLKRQRRLALLRCESMAAIKAIEDEIAELEGR